MFYFNKLIKIVAVLRKSSFFLSKYVFFPKKTLLNRSLFHTYHGLPGALKFRYPVFIFY